MNCDLLFLVVQGLVGNESDHVLPEVLNPHAVVVVKSSHVEEREVELEDHLLLPVADDLTVVALFRTDSGSWLDSALPHLSKVVEVLVFRSRWL